mgnify:CR=1 FL=1
MTSAPRSGPMALRPVAVVSSPVSRREDAVKQGEKLSTRSKLNEIEDEVATSARVAWVVLTLSRPGAPALDPIHPADSLHG